MINLIKVIIILASMMLLCYPFIPMKGKLGKVFVASSLVYKTPHNRKNVFFLLLVILEFIAVFLLFGLFDSLATMIHSVPFLGNLFHKASNSLTPQANYIFFVIKIFLVNILFVYAFVILKSFLKKAFIDRVFDINDKEGKDEKKGKKKKRFSIFNLFKRKKRKKDHETVSETYPNNKLEERKKKKNGNLKRIPFFVHSSEEDEEGDSVDEEEKTEEREESGDAKEKEEKETASEEDPSKKTEEKYGRLTRALLGLFFEGKEFEYIRLWVLRVRMVLRFFLLLTGIIYAVLFAVMLTTAFFPMPQLIYNILGLIKFASWYMYPTLSVLFLTEICNIFGASTMPPEDKKEKEKEKIQQSDKKRERRIRALLSELKKRFDADHVLRYYPEATPRDVPEYKYTSVAYSSALKYIHDRMLLESGHVVQSYMECLDAIYNDSHVYFPASFYSELGEYLIAYTYIRLLSGERQIFVVSEPEEKETLRTYISDRLMKMTGSSVGATWRIYTVDERLDQADVLIATPYDFIESNIIEQYPGFFEEASNAVFIDADRLISLESYACPIVATKLQRATDGRIRFVFLSLNVIKGFAAGSLPKFFCVDKVLSFSSAKESEAVSYIFWNRESKKRRIYSKNVQKNVCLEVIMADLACRYDMDGVRLITESAIEHAERKILDMHNVEINNLYKNVVDVNYMIYSDDRCNLSAALYACTRFRGRKKSIVHILSKPYLLREYFMSKATSEDHVVRSSFIQPRVTEHAERHKLSLLRIFCDATMGDGISVSEFERRMKEAIRAAVERKDVISSAYCRQALKDYPYEDMNIGQLAAYLIAALCDSDVCLTEEEEAACAAVSLAYKAKDFYIIIDPVHMDKVGPSREKNIVFNRAKEVFDRLLETNRKVELWLNDNIIGKLDTFPSRVRLEYIEGQSIVYKNSEYEIEHISDDGSAIYLRRENISIKNCLDTVLLRNYTFNSLEPIEDSAVLNNSQSLLEEIRVTRCKADFIGNTYGFYSLTADRQTLDFYTGVEGNPCVDTPHIRHYVNSGTILVELKSRTECSDGMRLLMSAVFNEFIRTIFPNSYHCIAIAPILQSPLGDENDYRSGEPEQRIKALYPYIKGSGEDFVENDPTRMRFVFINDSIEDVGVLDWFYDRSARYMQEFLTNVYSYLNWLKLCPEKQHYIYFGGEKLCGCFDLEGCCKLLEDYNIILSDEGLVDIETAGNEKPDVVLHRCSFCHKQMESGRFSLFDNNRFICADCFDTVDSEDQLEEIYVSVKDYLAEKLGGSFIFAPAQVKFDDVYDLPSDKIFSENYYRVDYIERTIYVERDNPVTNVAVSILRGIISLWQCDNACANHYANGQLYFEEIKYLRGKGEHLSADWIYENLPFEVKYIYDQINYYINFKDEKYCDNDETDTEESEETNETDSDSEVFEESAEEDESEEKSDEDEKTKIESSQDAVRTSFSFMIEKAAEISSQTQGEEPLEGEEYSNTLYNPNKVPRFWKRYLRDQRVDDGNEEDVTEAEEAFEGEELGEQEDISEDNSAPIAYKKIPDNAPPNDSNETESFFEEVSDQGEDSETGESELGSVDEKKRKKEEKKRLREEKRRRKHEEWVKKVNAAIEEEEKQKSLDFSVTDEPTKKKKSWFGKKKKETEAELDEKISEGVSDSDSEEDLTVEEEKTKKTKTKSQEKKKVKRKGGRTRGEKMCPYEEDESTNPKIRLYNDLVRAAYNYSEDPIDRDGLTNDEIVMVYNYVYDDYPELFWLHGFKDAGGWRIRHNFRCKDANGELDIKQIERKRAEIRKAAPQFTKGISRKTDPYKALLTIYRRLILKLDYDSIGLNANIDKNLAEDDKLRSLHNALTGHKVVCAGYATAMQYLLQSVGIVCGCVSSEANAANKTHAFNVLKLGKYCYYLDATWGDSSNTDSKISGEKDDIYYDYCCVPYEDFLKAAKDSKAFHIPHKKIYPHFEEFHYSNHEYFRYHRAYLTSYNEQELIRIFTETALRYDPKEMGRFSVDVRFATPDLAKYAISVVNVAYIAEKARAELEKKNKKAAKLLEEPLSPYLSYDAGTIKFKFVDKRKTKKKKDK